MTECLSDQDMLVRMQQELNSRFLNDRSLLPLGFPFTLHTEMHQHQHLHHHQHVVTPAGFLPSATNTTSLFPASIPMVSHLTILSQFSYPLLKLLRLTK